MNRAIALVSLVVLAAVAGAQDDVDGRAVIEVDSSRETVYVGERFVVTIRVGIEADFLATAAIQPFRRDLDVPVRIEAPWFDGAEGVRPLAIRGMRAGSGRKLALNDEVVAAYPVAGVAPDGRKWAIFDVRRGLVAERPGPLVIPAPRLHFAYATQFEETFVEGRVPRDRHDTFVDGAPLIVEVLPLPTAGRPAGFAGAVGQFSASAAVDRDTVDEGGTLKFTLEIDGSGDRAAVTAPALDERWFHVLGVLSTDRPGGRTFVYDVEVLRTVESIPPIPFVYFDPGPPAAYRVTETQRIPITVRGGRPEEWDREPQPDLPNVTLVPTALYLALAAGALLLLALAVVCAVAVMRRRSSGRRGSHGPVGPLARLRAQLDAGTNAADALAAYLAARLGCAEAAVISPDLPNRLEAAGVPAHLAARTSQTLERLVAARYGGGAARDARTTVRDLVAELELLGGSPSDPKAESRGVGRPPPR